MSDEIIKVLNYLSQRFGIAVDWTSSNMLPYLQELTMKYANYKLAICIMELVFEALLFMVAVKLVKVAKKQHHRMISGEVDCFHNDSCMILGISCGIGAALAILIDFTLIPNTLGDIIAYMTFPEKLILDELLQMIKNQ